MSTNHKDDGGAAFPVHPSAHERTDLECIALSGMTLRDYFAAKALQGELASQDKSIRYKHEALDGLARWAYSVAGAMLKARGES